MRFLLSICFVAFAFVCGGRAPSVVHAQAPTANPSKTPPRVTEGLQVFYDFAATKGNVVTDRTGTEPLLNLKISDPTQVKRNSGSLEMKGKSVAKSDGKALKVLYAVQWTGEISIEVWIKPANTKQNGPARILTYSRNSSERNFTLGQEGDFFQVRYRTSQTGQNGLPPIETKKGTCKTELTHVVFTRDRNGLARVYINGKQSAEMTIPGEIAWESQCQFALGDEFGGGRQWNGTYHLAAIYNRALAMHEVEQNFRAGEKAKGVEKIEQQSPNEKRFVSKIAPIFAEHCLECHDTVNHEGDLDLSKKKAAFAGGESGKVLVAGDFKKSLLWESIDSDAMPQDRSPLSAEEKRAIQEWIRDGADWPLEEIDVATFSHGDVAQNVFVRRLTVKEYVATVKAAVGVDISKDANELLPPDLRADGFNNTAYNLSVDLKHVEAFARLAERIAQQIDFAKLVRDHTRHKKVTDKNLRDVTDWLGRWLFRGPLAENELNMVMSVADDVLARGGSPEESLQLVVETMLQSPRFIYLVENQRGDGSMWPVESNELASRLSYMLWGAPPDRELLAAASSGDLYDDQKLRSQIDRMMKDSRAVERSKDFISQWLDLDRLANLQPNKKMFPEWNAELARDMRLETIAFFEDVAWKQKAPLTDLLNAKFTYASAQLAEHYDLKVSRKQDAPSMERYDLAEVPGRGGILTHASVLTVGGDEASMVSRGLFVLTDLMRGSVKDPPPCVDTTPVPPKEGLTQRGIALSRIDNVNCGGCHVKFEPLAFGLEKFDGIGAFHEKDEFGNELRDDGEIIFPGTDKPIAYKSSEEMMNILASSDRVRECINWKVAQFALGRPLTAADEPIMKSIGVASKKDGATWQSLMTAILMSDLVRKTKTERWK